MKAKAERRATVGTADGPVAAGERPCRRGWAVLLGAIALTAVLTFHVALKPGAVLQSGDNNVGQVASVARASKVAFPHEWMDQLYGWASSSKVAPTKVLQVLLPPRAYTNLVYPLTLALAAFFLALYLREKGAGVPAALFGALAAFWTGTNLTLVYAGHMGKYGILPCMAFAVFALAKWGRTGRGAWATLAGVAAGTMFVEQVDVGAFCALFLVPVALWEFFHLPADAQGRPGWKQPRTWLCAAVPAAVAAALLAGAAATTMLSTGAADSADEMSDAERWDYLTQWSQPPDECLDFVAPGYFGWRTAEPDGPYWGRLGRSGTFETTRQGFMNFKLESVYVGAIPLLFAVLALATARRREKAAERRLVWFWGAVAAGALVLTFGKYTPCYRLLAMLPGFSVARNPNKFIHFFQLAWGVLAALGTDAAWKMLPAGARRRWAVGAAAAGVLALLGAAMAWSSPAPRELAAFFPAQWLSAIQEAKAFALLWCGAMALAAGATLWFADAKRPWGRWLAWVPALAVLVDALFILGPRYIQAMPPGMTAENGVTEFLEKDLGAHRTAMLSQDGFYNAWTGILFPYLGIPCASVTQLPHAPADYMAFWRAVPDPMRQWQLSATSHWLVPAAVAKSVLGDPRLASLVDVGLAYVPRSDGAGGVAVQPLPATLTPDRWPPQAHAVLRLKTAAARVQGLAGWRAATDDEATLAALSDPAALFRPVDSAWIHLPEGEELLAPEGRPAQVRDIDIGTGRIRFTSEAEAPAYVRIAENWHSGWTCRIDGEEGAPVLRCDYLFQAVPVPAGTHEVELVFRPGGWAVPAQYAAFAMALLAAASLASGRRGPPAAA